MDMTEYWIGFGSKVLNKAPKSWSGWCQNHNMNAIEAALATFDYDFTLVAI